MSTLAGAGGAGGAGDAAGVGRSAARRATLVLVVEDEASFADAMVVGLEREGFEVAVAVDGPEALDRFDALAPDVVLLDVMLPGLSGVDVCRRLRRRSRVPIIMVSARDAEIDMVVGLEVGADDYVAKPFRLRELVARVRAVLRRAGGDDGTGPGGEAAEAPAGSRPAPTEGHGLSAGGVVVDPDRREASVDGRPLELPRKEFDLLAELVANAGRVLTRDQLIDRVWGHDYVGDTKTLDVHVKRLRAKLDADPHPEPPAHPDHQGPTERPDRAGRSGRIVTVRGVGYKLVT